MKLTLAFAISLSLASPAFAQDKAKPVAAGDLDALGQLAGKDVTVSGTVASVEAEDEEKPVELRFEGSELRVFVDAGDYWKAGGWGLDGYVGSPLFVHGKVAEREGKLEMRIPTEKHFHDNLESLLVSLPKPAKPVEPAKPKEEEKKYEPVSPGAVLPVAPGAADLQPKRDTASVQVIVPKFGGPTPEMVLSELTAEIVDAEEGGPMQATFELKPKIDPKPMGVVMTYLPKKYKEQGWPRNKAAHFVLEEVQSDSAPPNFAAAVLIDAMLSGVEIPENVVLFGGMKANGEISRSGDPARSDASYVEAIEIAAASARPPADPAEKERPKPEKTLYLLTGNVPDGTLDDFIIDEAWDTLNSTVVLRCANLEQAMTLLREIAEGGPVGKTITDLGEAQQVLRERSVRILNNPDVWARVVAAGKAFKGNATAYGYARMRARKVSQTYSLDRCIAHVHNAIETTQGGRLDKFTDRELRKYMRELASEMKTIEAKVHPEATALMAAALDYLEEIQDLASETRKVGKDGEISERVTKQHAEAKAAYEEARKAAKAKLANS